MAEGMNKVILLGNLGADPELRYTSNGTPLLNLRLATNESYLDRNRDPQERTEWHNVVVWGTRAEVLSRILSKGECVCVEGTLRTTSYEKDGTKHYRTEVVAREIRFTGRRTQPHGAPPHAPDDTPPPDTPPASRSQRAEEPARVGRNGSAPRPAPPPLVEELPF